MKAVKSLHAEEIDHLVAADGPTRYSYFVEQVADWEQVWGLRAPDGWVSVSDESGVPTFPVWPHSEYARLLANDSWSDAVPTSIELHEWIEEWLTGLSENGSKIAVFLTPHGQGVVVDPPRLRADLGDALAEYE